MDKASFPKKTTNFFNNMNFNKSMLCRRFCSMKTDHRHWFYWEKNIRLSSLRFMFWSHDLPNVIVSHENLRDINVTTNHNYGC